jgi:hypothetical protein
VLAAILLPSAVYAQAGKPSVDSLVSMFLQHGLSSSWQPREIFSTCPRLTSDQEKALSLLLDAELSRLQLHNLVISWSGPLISCRDPRLEGWFFDQARKSIARGEHVDEIASVWSAFLDADSPGIREFLESIVYDERVSADTRTDVGHFLFTRYTPDERLREYLRIFAADLMTPEFASFQTERVMAQHPDQVLGEVARLIEQNPQLARQAAFEALVLSSHQASDGAKAQFAAAMESLIQRRPELAGHTRTRIQGAVQVLRNRSRQ